MYYLNEFPHLSEPIITTSLSCNISHVFVKNEPYSYPQHENIYVIFSTF